MARRNSFLSGVTHSSRSKSTGPTQAEKAFARHEAAQEKEEARQDVERKWQEFDADQEAKHGTATFREIKNAGSGRGSD